MKKYLILMAALFMLSGCAGNTNTDGTDQTTDQTNAVVNADDFDVDNFTEGDFTLYGQNGIAFVSLGTAKVDYEERIENFSENVGVINVTFEDRLITSETEDAKTETVVNYISYDGPYIPVYTAKGIHTTGLKGKEENCSSPEDVIKAYDIDIDEESYITDQRDENNYCISLYYNGDERIVSPSGTELDGIDAQKLLRFTIKNGVVRNIDFYQYKWE